MKNSRFKTIISIAAAPVIVLCVHIICDQIFNLYGTIKWLDIPMHFVGGIAIALSANIFIAAVQKEHSEAEINPQLRALFIISLVALAAIIWEFAEFIGDTFIYHSAYFQANIGDTMKDFFMGLLGASVTAVVVTWMRRTIK